MAVISKRFLLFAGVTYYARGGWSEFEGDFDDLELAKTAGNERLEDDSCFRWFQVVDLLGNSIVFEKGEQF